MVPTALKLLQIKPVPHCCVNVVHGQLRRLEWISPIGLDHLIREERQKTVRIDQLHECAAVIELERTHNAVPSISRAHLCSLSRVQRLEMMGKQQLCGCGAGPR